MSGLPLSASTRALLEAAKSDAPTASARANIWAGVSTAAALGAAAATPSVAPSLASGTGVSASKLLAMGALLGSAVTVGVTLAVLRFMSPHAPPSGGLGVSPNVAVAAGVAATEGPETTAAVEHGGRGVTAAPVRAPGLLGGTPKPPGRALNVASDVKEADGTGSGSTSEADRAKTAGAGARAVHALARPSEQRGTPKAPGVLAAPAPKAAPVVDDPLMHEAALVAEARGSLVRGDAIGALRTIRAAEGLSSRGLEPEELSIEGRALRALGRDTEAAGVDSDLRSRFPDHALSR